MRLLLDACIPVHFRHALAPFDVQTALFAGLSRLSNGALLTAMQGRFDVLITVDTSLGYQQSGSRKSIAIIVMRAQSNSMPDLIPIVPAVLAAIASIKPSDIVEFSA
jgi:hypothetical protein